MWTIAKRAATEERYAGVLLTVLAGILGPFVFGWDGTLTGAVCAGITTVTGTELVTKALPTRKQPPV